MISKLRTAMLWRRLHQIAKEQGIDMSEIDRRLCLAPGTLEVMESCGIVPKGEILVRLRRYLGARTADMTRADESTLPLEVSRDLFVIREMTDADPDFDPNNVMEKLVIDVDEKDDCEYVGWKATDNKMRLAHVNKGDILVVRRQGIAGNGELVLAQLDGRTVVRRYSRHRELVWLETDGRFGSDESLVVENIHTPNPRIKIWGKVVSVIRKF